MTNRNHVRHQGLIAFPLIGLALLVTACSSTTASNDPAARAAVDPRGYATYVDANGNGINDYLEQPPYHDPGAGAPAHPFIDANGDGICDYAQNGSQSWHGPGYVDTNRDGICDRWQQGGPPPQGSGRSRPWCW